MPASTQQTLKRLYFVRKIHRGSFKSEESEFVRLEEWVKAGDWVLDIGANVGHYTARLSKIVGPNGRVMAFEPVPQTFELLSGNVLHFPFQNVTLFNVAVSDATGLAYISIPRADTGLDNFYMAKLTNDTNELAVFCFPIDSIKIPNRVTLIKLDVEGHELPALSGMKELIERDRPVLIVEGHVDSVAAYLAACGYDFEAAENSPNRIYRRPKVVTKGS